MTKLTIRSSANTVTNCSKTVIVIDATGKLGAGILVGNLAWFGSFDECQQLKSAHYCTVAAVITTPGTNTVRCFFF